jgi:hypothetical protein
VFRKFIAAAAFVAGFGVLAAPAVANAVTDIPSSCDKYGPWLDRDNVICR